MPEQSPSSEESSNSQTTQARWLEQLSYVLAQLSPPLMRSLASGLMTSSLPVLLAKLYPNDQSDQIAEMKERAQEQENQMVLQNDLANCKMMLERVHIRMTQLIGAVATVATVLTGQVAGII